jgi:hypothetical protein
MVGNLQLAVGIDCDFLALGRDNYFAFHRHLLTSVCYQSVLRAAILSPSICRIKWRARMSAHSRALITMRPFCLLRIRSAPPEPDFRTGSSSIPAYPASPCGWLSARY